MHKCTTLTLHYFVYFIYRLWKCLLSALQQSDYFFDREFRVDIKIHILSCSGMKDELSTQLLQIYLPNVSLHTYDISMQYYCTIRRIALLLCSLWWAKLVKYWVLCLNHTHTLWVYRLVIAFRPEKKNILQLYLFTESDHLLLSGVILKQRRYLNTDICCICIDLLVIFIYKYSMHFTIIWLY